MLRRFFRALKTARQLGITQSMLYARYQIGLRSGGHRRRTPIGGLPQPNELSLSKTGFRFPWREDIAAVLHPGGGETLLAESDVICRGQVRLFGSEAVDLQLDPGPELEHWSTYTTNKYHSRDIKFTWEHGRFGWAVTLARAYFISREAKHARTFWEYTETFLAANPPNTGPHWASAQEVAIRLICLVFCGQVFDRAKESTPQRKALLAQAVAQHADRIPPTLDYARAQNNNHLITEALGLYTAGIVLPEHHRSRKWRALGWKWFNRALQSQIAPDGAYAQHSANYQRLMLQAALWGAALAKGNGDELPEPTLTRLAAATRWLLSITDGDTGRLPNLGPNDGAYILPFTVQPFEDYRPVLQAAAQAFLGERPFPDGPWDEMAMWFGELKASEPAPETPELHQRLERGDAWAYLRAAKFTSRPGHADQLHLDLWWRGLNVARDPGTYLYNGDTPWDNGLAGTAVHNTISVSGADQMTRAGRFLWLDWAQATLIDSERDEEGGQIRMAVEHDGYRAFGLTHRREVQAEKNGRWVVHDSFSSRRNADVVSSTLHWLLPDWPWELNDTELRLQSPQGWISLAVKLDPAEARLVDVQLARAGELLSGSGAVEQVMGWYSPTYGQKEPALSFRVSAECGNLKSLAFISTWQFPG